MSDLILGGGRSVELESRTIIWDREAFSRIAEILGWPGFKKLLDEISISLLSREFCSYREGNNRLPKFFVPQLWQPGDPSSLYQELEGGYRASLRSQRPVLREFFTELAGRVDATPENAIVITRDWQQVVFALTGSVGTIVFLEYELPDPNRGRNLLFKHIRAAHRTRSDDGHYPIERVNWKGANQ